MPALRIAQKLFPLLWAARLCLAHIRRDRQDAVTRRAVASLATALKSPVHSFGYSRLNAAR
jgi:hypothetical protein